MRSTSKMVIFIGQNKRIKKRAMKILSMKIPKHNKAKNRKILKSFKISNQNNNLKISNPNCFMFSKTLTSQ
jgi:hypothetical protein